jgi:hypothetical protein
MLTEAKASCVQFAMERKIFNGQEAKAMDAWIKHDGRYAVVALTNSGNGEFKSNLCVRNSYSVMIPGPLQEVFWY